MNAETFIVGPMTFLAMVTITGFILIVLSHKVFGLVTHLPENVIRWIGGGVNSWVNSKTKAGCGRFLRRLSSKGLAGLSAVDRCLPIQVVQVWMRLEGKVVRNQKTKPSWKTI
nr:hypothetical protein [Methylomarinum sp. Ch1-1]MDP4519000.1 hypothetical protein [Methylomarinum sp. Ch1-1]MDP4523398.1 hypothetical protein [Methylomarinum sp. Ch1-1]